MPRLRVHNISMSLDGGERLLDGDAAGAYEIVEFVASPSVAHYRFARRG